MKTTPGKWEVFGSAPRYMDDANFGQAALIHSWRNGAPGKRWEFVHDLVHVFPFVDSSACEPTDDAKQERDANVRLICEAKDLLEALRYAELTLGTDELEPSKRCQCVLDAIKPMLANLADIETDAAIAARGDWRKLVDE